ncbi:MAG: hypothetical protein HF978_08850 [Desulfobacteraceae bacterium]|nr:PilZ domain-containing protein [Desulfobacteraceae bacterium]MBC2755641.1 hypothetical protein [Desulfobacteraceae bacterium]
MKKRRYTRSGVWPHTDATIKVQENISYDKVQYLTVKGKVQNLGSSGIFILTDKLVPIPATAEITINFDSTSNIPGLLISASGKTVRLTKQGVGIEFTSIDLKKLQTCIIKKINSSDISECKLDTVL